MSILIHVLPLWNKATKNRFWSCNRISRNGQGCMQILSVTALILTERFFTCCEPKSLKRGMGFDKSCYHAFL